MRSGCSPRCGQRRLPTSSRSARRARLRLGAALAAAEPGHPARPARNRRKLAFGAAVAAAAAAAIAVPALLPGSGGPLVTRAWAVTRSPGGAITVTVGKALRDQAGLQRALRADGVPGLRPAADEQVPGLGTTRRFQPGPSSRPQGRVVPGSGEQRPQLQRDHHPPRGAGQRRCGLHRRRHIRRRPVAADRRDAQQPPPGLRPHGPRATPGS